MWSPRPPGAWICVSPLKYIKRSYNPLKYPGMPNKLQLWGNLKGKTVLISQVRKLCWMFLLHFMPEAFNPRFKNFTRRTTVPLPHLKEPNRLKPNI
jgi:hypothetical protein